MGNRSRILGKEAEDIAVYYLTKKGYDIICRNYYSKLGEIDIIATIDEYIVFVEVKYRKNFLYGIPSSAVTYNKKQKIIKTALIYVSENNITNGDFRFDIIEISGQGLVEINHITNAFY